MFHLGVYLALPVSLHCHKFKEGVASRNYLLVVSGE